MGTQAVKGVEIGEGFALAELRGSEAHDEIVRDEGGFSRETNRAGGIEAGISNGEDDRRPRGDEAAADADEAAALRRSRDRRAGERRSSSAPTSPRSKRSRSSPRRASPSSSRARRGRSSAATRSRTSSAPGAPTWSGSPGRRARTPPRARRLHGRRQVDGRRPQVAERTARPFVDLDRVIERRHGPIPAALRARRGRVPADRGGSARGGARRAASR